MDYKALLSDLLTELSLSKKKFAEGMKLSQGNVSDWFNRPGYRPSIDALKRISETYNVNLNWLVTGEGPMFNVVDPRARGKSELLRLPVVAEIAAGRGMEAFDVEPSEYLGVDPKQIQLPGPYLCFKVNGESMIPYILPGDYAVVTQRWHELNYNNRVCAVMTIDGLTLKRFYIPKNKKRALLIPFNPGYPVIEYNQDSPDITVIGLLVLIVRKFT